MDEATLHTMIPKERVGALIGKRGIVKRKIEEALNVRMSINSRTGSVEITQRTDAPDPTSTFNARDVVNAIGRGFSPEDAFRLLNDGVILRVIDLRDYFGKSDSDIQRIKGRIIGKKGRTR
ncbi:MAG: KH domain-containing protein, partial [Candidatus Bathyarchaeota archaeon]|nr:KH domain-containing protein [Candidatus Bathyarchaeota archaeon]